jgi:hypothetical protein
MLITPWSLNARIPGFSSRTPQDVAMKTPDYDALQKKANQAGCFGIILLGKKGSLSACFIKMDSDNLQPTTIIIVVIFFVVVIIQVSQ